MATPEYWSLSTNPPISNNGTIVDARLSTISSTNTTGYVPVNSASSDPIIRNLSYAVQNDGKVTYQLSVGTNTFQYNNLQELANAGVAGYSGTTTDSIKSSLATQLTASTKVNIPSTPSSSRSASGSSADPATNPDGTSPLTVSSAIDDASLPTISSIGARDNYPNDNVGSDPEVLGYPLDRKKHASPGQDYIKFQIFKYRPARITTAAAPTPSERTTGENIGTIVLPIQPSITDENSVQWGEDTLDPIQKAGVGIAMNTMNSNGDVNSVVNTFMGSVSQQIQEIATGPNKDNVEKAIKAYFAGAAVGNQNLLSRISGAVLNPNLELLFQRPNLRTFSFTFRLAARSPEESRRIKSIIRTFKQAMSVQKSGELFLTAPNVFEIGFIFGNTNDKNPYLPLIKTSALTRCSVDYTPDQSYMTYYDGSMTSYGLSLSFQELTPVYNNDYGVGYTNIGY